MSPVDPQSIRDAEADHLVPKDTVCTKCQYPLEGLARGGVCPECGTPIRVRRKPGVQARDNLTDAPVEWLRRFRWAAIGLAIFGGLNGLLQCVAFLIAESASSATLVATLIIGCGLFWTLAVLVCTCPRPHSVEMRQDPKREFPRTRMLARLTQFAWPVQGVLFWILFDAASNAPFAGALVPGETWMRVGIAAAQLVGIAGFAPLCIWLSHIADWAQDTGLAGRLRTTAVLIGGGGALFTLCVWATQFFTPLGLIAFFALLAYEVGVFLFLVSQFQLASIAHGAVSNAIHSLARDRRILERKARRAMAGQPREGSPLADLAAERGEQALEPCQDCGYDLTGLPPHARCPECGRMPDQNATHVLRVPTRTTTQETPVELDAIPLVGDEDEDNASPTPGSS